MYNTKCFIMKTKSSDISKARLAEPQLNKERSAWTMLPEWARTPWQEQRTWQQALWKDGWVRWGVSLLMEEARGPAWASINNPAARTGPRLVTRHAAGSVAVF